MTNFIPLFPLGIVVYPGEALNLHIFEPRYKQLITDCYAHAKPFGIPVVLKNNIAELGTIVEITEIVKLYEDGKMDIKTRGVRIFRVLEIIKSVPDKLYNGAIVTYPENEDSVYPKTMEKLLTSIRQLHLLLKVEKDFKKPDINLRSYDVAHHAGLSLQEEYELLGLWLETQRLEYLKRHLNKILPIISGAENLKEKIQLNGHFKELKGFDLE